MTASVKAVHSKSRDSLLHLATCIPSASTKWSHPVFTKSFASDRHSTNLYWLVPVGLILGQETRICESALVRLLPTPQTCHSLCLEPV